VIRLVLFLLAAVAVSLLAAWLADHPGQVALTWQGMHVETSFAILMIAVLLLGLLFIIAFEIVRLLGGAPRRIGRRLRRSRTDRGYQALAQGLVAAAAGDAAAAKALNRRADKLLGHAPATLLLSAQAAQLEGDEVAARARFQEMLEHQETEFLGLRGLLAQAMKNGDWENALELARRAYLRRPNTSWVLTTLFDLQTRSGLWTEALSTVGDMARHKLIDRPTATRWRALIYHQRAAAQRAAGRPYEALYLARKAHKLQPDFAPIAVQASALAEQSNQPRVARKALEGAWKAKPHPALAKAYLGLAGNSSASERLKVVQRLHELQPKHLESELALAEQAIAAKAWPAAREALERARKMNPTASVYRLLAEVAQAEGDGERARAYLAQAVDAAPDHAWLCETTGQVRANWSAFGPDGRFDSLRWGAPPKIVPLIGDERAELIPPSPERAPQVPVPMPTVEPTLPARDAKVDAA
jgi:HemY protein